MGYRIGLDLGVGSVGWAVLRTDDNGLPNRIEALGSRVFDKAENPKDGSSLAAKRREARSVRRRLRRRRHRRDRVLNLLENYNILSKEQVYKMYNDNNYRFQKNVYELRVEGLDTKLTDKELARVLISLVKRRGYKSNSKSEEVNDKETGKIFTATTENEKVMKEHNYRTVAEMYLKDERFNYTLDNGLPVLKIRNTTDDYKATVNRKDLVNEIKLILEKQKELNPKVTDEFIEKYLEIFESQRAFDEGPGGNSPYGGNQIEKMLGRCSLEENEPRAMKATYTFEYFKLLQDLNHIKLVKNGKGISLTKEDKDKIIALFSKADSVDYSRIRKALNLDNETTFNMVRYNASKLKENEDLIEVSEKATKLKEYQSYHKIRKALDKVKKDRIEELSKDELDTIGYCLSVYKNDDKRIDYLKSKVHSLTDKDIEQLLELSFSKSGNLSIKAMKKLIPELETGITYDKAVENVYGKDKEINKKRRTRLSLSNLDEEIPNPVVRRAVSQTIKVVNAIVQKYGDPDIVNIELARDLAKTFQERTDIDKRNKERQAVNEKVKEEIEELGKLNVTGQDIIKYRLWKEQGEICVYSGRKISPDELFTELVDVDHIIPYSKCFDDSFNNKVLVLASENRMKGDRVPLQYLKEDGKNVDEFKVRIENMYRNNRKNFRKYQKLKTESISRDEIKGFKQRSLEDTQYLSRVVHNLIRNNLKFSDNENLKDKRRVYVVNGTITAQVRKMLGINKVRANGDEHHAIDATVIATISQKMINDITKYYQYGENKFYIQKGDNVIDIETGEIIDFNDLKAKDKVLFPEPYQGFRKELEIRTLQDENLMHEELKRVHYDTYENILKIKPIFVSRMPNRKINGQIHGDTIRGKRKEGNIYYSLIKTPLQNLKLNDKKDAIAGYPEKQIRDDLYLYKGLLERLQKFGGDAKEAFKEYFYKPNKDGSKGQIVKKVKIEKRVTSFTEVNKGIAENVTGSMIRIDVFKVEGEGYYFIPIYRSQIKSIFPTKACIANKPEEDWKKMKDEDFIFSLYPNDLLYIDFGKTVEFESCNKEIKEKRNISKVFCYYNSADTHGAAINVLTQNNEFKRRGIGVKTLQEIKKYQVDVLGNISEVKIPEKRVDFSNMKGGKKA